MHDTKHAGFPWTHAAPAPARAMPHSFTTLDPPDKERVRLRCIWPGCTHTFRHSTHYGDFLAHYQAQHAKDQS